MTMEVLMPRASTGCAPLPFLSGRRVYLRPLGRDDLNDTYLGWLNDPEVTRYMETGTFPTTREELEHYYQSAGGTRDRIMLAIVEAATGLHIGNIKLEPIQWVHRRATLGIMIGDKRFWGRGISTEACRLTVQHAFRSLNLRRIELGVYADHSAAIRVYERLGFRVEGRLRQTLFREDRYWDSLCMGLLREEFVDSESTPRR
jgi:RimJ/RimL family protein N-acetyltransferase